MDIEQVLARRTDLSTFLVHLTRDTDTGAAIDNLIGILSAQAINAGSSFGMASSKLHEAEDIRSQKVVCFTETPLENVNLLTEEISGRNCSFAPYGIAISRKQGRKAGANPVWYLDITPGHNWLTNPLNSLIDEAIATGDFSKQHISQIAPFLEQMGSNAGGVDDKPYRKEFWWEREWRHVGSFQLPNRYIVLCPSSDITRIKDVVDNLEELVSPSMVSYIDPRWSLEMIIGKLAGMTSDDLGAF